MLSPALSYLIRTRWRNRVLGVLRGLKTPGGLLTAVVVVAVVSGLLLGAGLGGTLSVTDREAVFVSILGFLLVMGVLNGLGQRGLVFTAADLDFLFPAPISRRQLLLYHFVTQYLMAALMGLLYVFALGGRFLPSPLLFFVGVFLCQVTTDHLAAAAAELSLMVADGLYRRLRPIAVLLVVLITLGGLILLVAGFSGIGAVPGRLAAATDATWMKVLFFPAFQAVALGSAPDLTGQALALGSLLACAAGSFLFVSALRVDFVEGSFVTSRKVHRRVHNLRRGVHDVRVKRSVEGPRGRLFRGAGAVLWLNWMTLRRQLRALLGGLMVVVIMFTVIATRQRGQGGAGELALFLLALIPLWMPLPLGFRLPRDQLSALRLLPLPAVPLATALLFVPILVPFVMQMGGVLLLAGTGRIDVGPALSALPAYMVVSTTFISIESVFVLKRATPTSVNILQAAAQILLQFVALLPGLLSFALAHTWIESLPLCVLLSLAVQGPIAYALIRWAGRSLQQRDSSRTEGVWGRGDPSRNGPKGHTIRAEARNTS